MYVQKFGQKLEKPFKREKSKDGQSRSRNSIVLEDWEAFISSIREMVNTKKPSKTQGESWKFQWRPQCFAQKGTKKHSRLQETEAKSGESNKIPKTKHASIVEAHESTRQRLESSLPKDNVDRYTCRTPHFHMNSHCTDHTQHS